MDISKHKPLSQEELIERIDHMTNVVFPAIKDRTNEYVDKMKEQFSKHNTIVDDFKEGSLVFVRIPTMTGSLSPSYEGPFKIIRKTRGGSYVLVDETGLLMHRDYAPSELKKASVNKDEEGEIYEIDGIVDHRGKGNNIEYRVRWKGYSQDEDQWLTASQFTHLSTIENYWKRIGKAPINKRSKNKIINSGNNKPSFRKGTNERSLLQEAIENSSIQLDNTIRPMNERQGKQKYSPRVDENLRTSKRRRTNTK